MKIKSLFIFTLFLFIFSVGPLHAADPFEMSLEENINNPTVPTKKHNSVRESVDHLRSTLEKSNLSAGKLRQGEVLMISIPCSVLFRSNETILSPEGRKKLDGLKILDNIQNKYKLLIAVHTDNTGDVEYAESITADRANAIDDYLTEALALNAMYIIPYGLGHDEPLGSDESVSDRAKNRRVEIYIVPQEALFTRSK